MGMNVGNNQSQVDCHGSPMTIDRETCVIETPQQAPRNEAIPRSSDRLQGTRDSISGAHTFDIEYCIYDGPMSKTSVVTKRIGYAGDRTTDQLEAEICGVCPAPSAFPHNSHVILDEARGLQLKTFSVERRR
jgi:hypothetical protein